ncbi:MAG: HIT domain-containing protein [Nanoarchaeota archaeon]
MDKDCVFCKISNGKIPRKTIYENDNFFSVLDANPVTEGHSLVIPKKHFKTFLDLPQSLGQELIDCVKNTALKIIDEKKVEGFNVLNNNFSSAGQAVNHVHFHIIPRRRGDGINVLG